MVDPAMERRAIEAALDVRLKAYAPYSKFLVGASLVAGDEIFRGCNVENASFGLTICAERTALFSAVAVGRLQFDLLVVATTGGYAPCGACRQVLVEFAPRLDVLRIDVNEPSRVIRHELADLLPEMFRLGAE